MGHRQDHGVVATRPGLLDQRQVIFPFGGLRFHPGIVDIHLGAVDTQGVDQIDDPGIAYIRAILLEGQTHHQQTRPLNRNFCADHQAYDIAGNIFAHPVIDPAAGQNHIRMMAHRLGLVGQIVGIDADAVPTHQARAKVKEIPLGGRGVKHIGGIDTHTPENHCQFINQSDIDIPLGVFNHLGGLGDLDGRGAVNSRIDHLAIEAGQFFRGLLVEPATTLTMDSSRWFWSPGLIRSGL